MRAILACGLILAIGVLPAAAQMPPADARTTPADTWRAVARHLEPGDRVRLELRSGQRLSATLLDAGTDDVLIQPRTRVAVPAQRVAYDEIVVLSRDEARGLGAGKAVLLGAATGAGVFFGLLLILVSGFAD